MMSVVRMRMRMRLGVVVVVVAVAVAPHAPVVPARVPVAWEVELKRLSRQRPDP